jgi:hypothetical protein
MHSVDANSGLPGLLARCALGRNTKSYSTSENSERNPKAKRKNETVKRQLRLRACHVTVIPLPKGVTIRLSSASLLWLLELQEAVGQIVNTGNNTAYVKVMASYF